MRSPLHLVAIFAKFLDVAPLFRKCAGSDGICARGVRCSERGGGVHNYIVAELLCRYRRHPGVWQGIAPCILSAVVVLEAVPHRQQR